MSADSRRRLVRRLDISFFIGLLVTSGLAALLFWARFYDSDEAEGIAEQPSPTFAITASATPVGPRNPVVTAFAAAIGIHTGPGEVFPVYDTFGPNEGAVILALSEDGAWYYIDWPLDRGGPGWIPAAGLETSGDLNWLPVNPGPPAPTATLTQIPTTTNAPTATDTLIPTPTNTPTATATGVPTQTPSLTSTSTRAPTFTPTPWPTPAVDPLALVALVSSTPFTMTGTALPGDTVEVYDQGELIGSGVADESGEWEVDFPAGLPTGQHALTVVAVGPEGAASQPVPVGFEIASAPTATMTYTATATFTLTLTPTLTQTPTLTLTPTFTDTPEPSPQPPTSTPTATATPEPLIQPSVTSSVTPSPVPPTVTPSMTHTPSPLPPSKTPIPPTSTLTPSLTSSPSVTPAPVTLVTAAVIVPSNTSTAAATSVPLASPVISRPVIDSPASGETYAPGTIPFRGTAPPGVRLDVQDQAAGSILASVQVSSDGSWQASVDLYSEGNVTLSVLVPAGNGAPLISDPVTITIAPSVQPNTGDSPDSDEAGRTFTALLALLLSAGGFSAYFAGRLLYLLAHDRMKPG